MRISLFGGPGVGKSTLAARIFAHLKQLGVNVELVQEFVKSYVYANRRVRDWDYVYTFAKQFEAERRMLQGVDVIVTDSPLLLQCVYAERHRCPVWPQLTDIATEFERKHPAMNLLVKRSTQFQLDGRWESPKEARELDEDVEDFLTETGVTLAPDSLKTLYPIDPTSEPQVQQLLELLEIRCVPPLT